MQFPGSLGEIQLFRHCHEIAQVTQFHNVSPAYARVRRLNSPYSKAIAQPASKY
jgi:hypothetical protein